jgi:hypothetical protein
MIQDDINQFEEMVAECYSISIGTKRTIEITKETFDSIGIKLSPNNIFYEVASNKKTEKKLVLITDKKLKIEILKNLHIL